MEINDVFDYNWQYNGKQIKKTARHAKSDKNEIRMGMQANHEPLQMAIRKKKQSTKVIKSRSHHPSLVTTHQSQNATKCTTHTHSPISDKMTNKIVHEFDNNQQ